MAEKIMGSSTDTTRQIRYSCGHTDEQRVIMSRVGRSYGPEFPSAYTHPPVGASMADIFEFHSIKLRAEREGGGWVMYADECCSNCSRKNVTEEFER